ncbi:MAG: DUF1893 domain-containing protein [Oscillospiraceae bacterium]|jgi:hypothetical protein
MDRIYNRRDLDRAEEILIKEGVSCVLVKGEDILKTGKRGVKPLLDLIDSGTDVSGYSAADKIVGKAAAMLYKVLGVGAVYAVTMSENGDKILADAGIYHEYAQKVEIIMNRTNTGMCPMEASVIDIDDPQEAIAALKKKIAELSSAAAVEKEAK